MSFQGRSPECQAGVETLGRSLETFTAGVPCEEPNRECPTVNSCQLSTTGQELELSTTGRHLEGSLDSSPPAKRHRTTPVVSTTVPAKDAVLPTAEGGDHLKATKRDDAAVRTELWQGFLLKPLPHLLSFPRVEEHLEALRRFLLARWKRCTTASLFSWLKGKRVHWTWKGAITHLFLFGTEGLR